jgi:hypothetical protein
MSSLVIWEFPIAFNLARTIVILCFLSIVSGVPVSEPYLNRELTESIPKSFTIDPNQALFFETIAEKYYNRQKSERSRVTDDFIHFNPNFPCVLGETPLGEDTPRSVEDGHKFGCGIPFISSVPIVYSFGSNRQQDFEASILRIHPNARIYTFELVESHIPAPHERNPKVDWNNIGLGYDNSTGSKFKSFQDIMISKGHSYVDVVKMDIDGGEWNWVFKEGFVLERIGQLLIEIHVIDLPKLLYPGKTLANLIDEIEKYNMRMFFKEINHAYPFCCSEFSFVQRDWLHWDSNKLSAFVGDPEQIKSILPSPSSPGCGDALFVRGTGRKTWVVFEGARHWVLRTIVDELHMEEKVQIWPNDKIVALPEDELGFTTMDCLLLNHPNIRKENTSLVFDESKKIHFADFYSKNIMLRENYTLSVFPSKIHGLADCILGIAGSFVVALLTGRTFKISQHRYFRHVSEAFESPNVDWSRRPEEPWVLNALENVQYSDIFNQSIRDSGLYAAVNAHNHFKELTSEYLFDSMFNNKSISTVFLICNRGPVSFFDHPHLKELLYQTDFTPSNIFGSVISYLFKPKSEIFENMGELVKLSKDTSIQKIAIQVRIGDSVMKSGARRPFDITSVKQYFQCAEQIDIFSKKNSKWFLFTDSLDLRQAAIKMYGSKIVTPTDAPIEHSADSGTSLKGFKRTAAEWWLLGEADYFIISESSGYGKTAAVRKMREPPTNIFMVSGRESKVDCSENMYANLDRLKSTWSGL